MKNFLLKKVYCIMRHHFWDRKTMFWSYMGAKISVCSWLQVQSGSLPASTQQQSTQKVHGHLRTNTGTLSTIMQKSRIVLISTLQRHSKLIKKSFWTTLFSGNMPRSGIAGSCDRSIFSFLRSVHTVLQYVPPAGCANVHCSTVHSVLQIWIHRSISSFLDTGAT